MTKNKQGYLLTLFIDVKLKNNVYVCLTSDVANLIFIVLYSGRLMYILAICKYRPQCSQTKTCLILNQSI